MTKRYRSQFAGFIILCLGISILLPGVGSNEAEHL